MQAGGGQPQGLGSLGLAGARGPWRMAYHVVHVQGTQEGQLPASAMTRAGRHPRPAQEEGRRPAGLPRCAAALAGALSCHQGRFSSSTWVLSGPAMPWASEHAHLASLSPSSGLHGLHPGLALQEEDPSGPACRPACPVWGLASRSPYVRAMLHPFAPGLRNLSGQPHLSACCWDSPAQRKAGPQHTSFPSPSAPPQHHLLLPPDS